MGEDWVLDASVAVKLYFLEDGSDVAKKRIVEAGGLVAPDLLQLEVASAASDKLRRSVVTEAEATRAVLDIPRLLDEIVPTPELTVRAFELASAHGFSVYDATYIALAERRGLRVLTADAKMVKRAAARGLQALMEALI